MKYIFKIPLNPPLEKGDFERLQPSKVRTSIGTEFKLTPMGEANSTRMGELAFACSFGVAPESWLFPAFRCVLNYGSDCLKQGMNFRVVREDSPHLTVLVNASHHDHVGDSPVFLEICLMADCCLSSDVVIDGFEKPGFRTGHLSDQKR